MDKTLDLLNMLREGKTQQGIRIVKAVTGEPDPLTFVFEGTKQALGATIFEIPLSMYPIREGDRFTVYSMFGDGPAYRWAFISKLNGCNVSLATMTGPNSAKIDGVNKTYTADELIAPMGLIQGDRVVIAPVIDNNLIKYVVLNKLN